MDEQNTDPQADPDTDDEMGYLDTWMTQPPRHEFNCLDTWRP